MNQIKPFLALLILIFFFSCKKDDTTISVEQDSYEINENGTHQDFLTPTYYNTTENNLRDEINTFIHFSRLDEYQHPFQNPNGKIIPYATNRAFGMGIGLRGTSQHHPTIDLHPANPSEVSLYAAQEGIVHTYRDSSKYRHYLTINKEVKDSENNSIGKLVILYAHIDLDLDENQSIQLNGQYVNKGDLVSENLYSGTMGGAHLHFEIRFYRNTEIGTEEFYSWENNEIYAIQSSGPLWSYGYWNNTIGYGFGNPMNFEIE